MQHLLASASRKSGAELGSRRIAASRIATTATKATLPPPPPPLLRRSTPTLAPSSRRPLVLQPPRASSFFDNLLPPKVTSKSALSLVDSLLEAVEGTDAGASDKTSREQREEIARLASSLKRFRMRNPAQSPLLWGRYRVSYCSNPNAAGGPVLRSGPGRALARSQVPTQELVEGEGGSGGDGGSLIRNRVEFSALGVFGKTSAAQEGPLTVTGPNSYRVVLEKATRDFEILYLDERVRVAEFVPSDGRERQLFVFERISGNGGFAVEEEEEEAEEESSSSPSSSSSSSQNSFFGDFGSFFIKPAESLATVVEREEGGAASRSGGGAKAKSGSGAKKASAGAKPQQPPPPSPLTAPGPAALFESFVSKITGDDRDTELIRSLKNELAAATAEVKEAERQEKEALRTGAPVLSSTAKEREELARAKREAQQAAARAQRLAEEAAEAADALARAVAKTK